MDHGRLPACAAMLDAKHRAQRRQLESMVASLPLARARRVLDVACGDGYYSRLFSRLLTPDALVVAIDRSANYLSVARRRRWILARARIEWICADAECLPFADGEFDLAFCAHSLNTLPDPVATLAAMRRAVGEGGCVAVLENDSRHSVLLPWPIELEMAIRQAELATLRRARANPGRAYIGRALHCHFHAAGMTRIERRTFLWEHRCPLNHDQAEFCAHYFDDLRRRVWPHLESSARCWFDRLCRPENDEYILRQRDAVVTLLETLCWARVGEAAAPRIAQPLAGFSSLARV